MKNVKSYVDGKLSTLTMEFGDLATESDANLEAYFASGATAPSSWRVGDTRSVKLTTGETRTLVLMDDTPYSQISGNAPRFIWGFKECLNAAHSMNDSNTNSGGWDSTSMRSYLNSTVLQQLPKWLQNSTKTVKVIRDKGQGTSGTNTSNDKLFIPDEKEVLGKYAYGMRSADGSLHQWNWCKTSGSRVKTVNGSADYWWLSTSHSYSDRGFVRVGSDGSVGCHYASNDSGVAVSGCF